MGVLVLSGRGSLFFLTGGPLLLRMVSGHWPGKIKTITSRPLKELQRPWQGPLPSTQELAQLPQAAQEADAKAEAEARKQRTEAAVAAHLKAHQDKLNNMLSEIDTPKENVLSDKTGGNPVKTGVSDATPKNNVVHEDKSPEQSPARPSPKDKGGLMSKATRIQQAAMRTKREQEAVKNYEESDARHKGFNSYNKFAGADSMSNADEKNIHTEYTGPEPIDWNAARNRFISGMKKLAAEAPKGIHKAFDRASDEIVNNEELHKGVEFGFKAAGVVTKEVARLTVTKVRDTIIENKIMSYAFKIEKLSKLRGLVTKNPYGVRSWETTKRVKEVADGLNDYPELAHRLGEAIQVIHSDVYK